MPYCRDKREYQPTVRLSVDAGGDIGEEVSVLSDILHRRPWRFGICRCMKLETTAERQEAMAGGWGDRRQGKVTAAHVQAVVQSDGTRKLQKNCVPRSGRKRAIC